MTSAQLLTDGFGRIREVVHGAAGGLTPRQLAHQPVEGANSIAWLVW
ncbi:DinB family protein, partial [Micromonospora aurantiaca]|nr:DinB family protein [Micromonospora aurantiaca]